MKRFVWRLQRVLDIKAKEEQSKRTELLELTERLAQARGALLMRKRILEKMIKDIASKNPQRRLGDQEFFIRCSGTNDELIKKLKGKVTELESKQREKIAEVLKVRRFKEGLERLRSEAKRRFIEEQEKLEQKDMEERAIVSFSRKMTEADRRPVGRL